MAGLAAGELAGREFGEVCMAWVDDPPNGPRLRIVAAARRVMITLPLLALIDAGESPWAELRGAGSPGDGDPYGYRGSVLRIEAGDRTELHRGMARLTSMDEAALRRVMLYGTCEECGQPRNVLVTDLQDGSRMMELWCPACRHES
jgi:hypothetical protein